MQEQHRRTARNARSRRQSGFPRPTGEVAITGGWGTVVVWDLTTGTARYTRGDRAVSVFLSEQATRGIAVYEHGVVQFWNLDHPENIQEHAVGGLAHAELSQLWDGFGEITAADVKGDGTYFVVGDNFGGLVFWTRSQDRFWTCATSPDLPEFPSRTGIRQVQLSQDGQQVLGVTGPGHLLLWKPLEDEQPHEVLAHDIVLAAFGPRDGEAISISADGVVVAWNLQDHAPTAIVSLDHYATAMCVISKTREVVVGCLARRLSSGARPTLSRVPILAAAPDASPLKLTRAL